MHEKKILIADDSPVTIFTLSKILIRQGYTVFTAESYDEAFETVERIAPDLVISGVKVKNCYGMELFWVTRSVYKKIIPFIIIGPGDAGITKEMAESGICHFISESFETHKMLSLVKKALKNGNSSAGNVNDHEPEKTQISPAKKVATMEYSSNPPSPKKTIPRKGIKRPGNNTLKEAVQTAKKRAILSALKATNQNLSEAAKLLGISRNSLYYNLDINNLVYRKPHINDA